MTQLQRAARHPYNEEEPHGEWGSSRNISIERLGMSELQANLLQREVGGRGFEPHTGQIDAVPGVDRAVRKRDHLSAMPAIVRSQDCQHRRVRRTGSKSRLTDLEENDGDRRADVVEPPPPEKLQGSTVRQIGDLGIGERLAPDSA